LISAHDYEIRFMNADGGLSFLVMTNCATDEQARESARRMFRHGFATYEIWRDYICIDSGVCMPAASTAAD
jgi:hypothetical protein